MVSGPAASRVLRCHYCGSEDIALNEVIQEHARYQDGLILDEDGAIRARGRAVFSAGDPQPKLTTIDCQACGKWWRPRRPFAGSEVSS